jgi:Ferredoxin-like domain in Api92-like protein
MANWCNNRVVIQSKDFKEKFITHNKNKSEKDYELFAPILPRPQELNNVVSPVNIVENEEERLKQEDPSRFITVEHSLSLIDKYGANNWYDWSIKNWGTKWEAQIMYTSGLEDTDDNTLVVDFDTAWSPPTKFFDYLANEFPDTKIELKSVEPNMDFSLYATWEKGANEHFVEYESADSQIGREMLGDDFFDDDMDEEIEEENDTPKKKR